MSCGRAGGLAVVGGRCERPGSLGRKNMVEPGCIEWRWVPYRVEKAVSSGGEWSYVSWSNRIEEGANELGRLVVPPGSPGPAASCCSRLWAGRWPRAGRL